MSKTNREEVNNHVRSTLSTDYTVSCHYDTIVDELSGWICWIQSNGRNRRKRTVLHNVICIPHGQKGKIGDSVGTVQV